MCIITSLFVYNLLATPKSFKSTQVERCKKCDGESGVWLQKSNTFQYVFHATELPT